MKNYSQVRAEGTPYDSTVRSAAEEQGIPYNLLHKLIYIESRFDPNAQSPTGPKGIAQFTKATGKAYGLSDADRLDPIKSIKAAATHLKDLLKSTNGDQSLAALAYNQGLGASGRKQQEAMKLGNHEGVSKEGLNYMSMMQDSIEPSQVGKYEFPSSHAGGALPKAASFPEPSGRGLSPRVPTHAEQLQTAGKAQGSDADPTLFQGVGTAAAEGITNSTIGSGIRAAVNGHGLDVIKDIYAPAWTNSYKFTPEDEQAIRDSGLPASYINTLGGASNSSNLREMISHAQDSKRYTDTLQDTGAGAQLVGGIAGAIGDPFSYVPIVGASANATKFLSTQVLKRAASIGLQSGAAAGVGEAVRTSVVGGDLDLDTAIAGGILFGGGLSVLADGLGSAMGRTVSRLEANETARLTGQDSLARNMAVVADETIPTQNINGIDFKEGRAGDGAVVLMDGTTVSATSPLHPRFHEVPERAAAGVQTGGFTELGLKVLRSENPTIRGIGQDLMRSPTGMQSGSNGASKMVASDIADYLKSQDNMFFNDFNTKSNALFNDPAFAFGAQPREVALGHSYRRISDAIENPEKYSQSLTKAEKELMESINTQMSSKLDDLMNPSKFGNKESKALLESTAHGEKYVPNVYDDIALNTYTQRFGGTKGLQDMISKSWMQGYNSNPKVKARVDARIKAAHTGDALTPEGLRAAAEKLANDKAYGIAYNSEFTYSAVTNDAIDAGKGLENNSFLDARHPFDSDSPVKMDDGTDFRVNDLRSYRLERLLPQYSRRVNGDVAVMGATGKTIRGVKESITALNYATSRDGKLKSEGEALMGSLSILTGRSRREGDGVFGTLLRSMNDAAFVTKNAYMGVQNITEIAGLVTKGHTTALLHGVPMLNKLMGGLKKNDPESIKALQQIVFGKELDDSLRPRRADIRETLRANSDAPDWFVGTAANIKYVTGEISAKSPLTKVLQSTTNYIVDAARQGFLNDIVTSALKGSDDAFGASMRKAASISDKQWKGMNDVIRDFITVGQDGKMVIKEGMMRDPRAFDLWRMGDKLASEAIQRTGGLGSQSSKAYGPMVNMALQFKTFVLRGVNSKALRSFYDATKNGRAIENIANAAIGVGLALPFYMASTYTKSLGVPEAQRQAFLDKQFEPEMLAYAALSRSNILGTPLGVANIISAPLGFDQGAAVRTSILPKEAPNKTDRPEMFTSASKTFGSGLLDQVPALGLAANAVSAGHNAAGLYSSKGGGEALAYRTGLYNSVRNLVPNDPLSQSLLLKWFEAQGIQAKKQ